MKITMDILVCYGLRFLRQTAEVMTEAEFRAIEDEKDTPVYVVVGDKLYYNSYTCYAGFDGTCNCFSHPRKEWIESPLSEYSFRGYSALYCPRCKRETNFFIRSNLPKYDTEQCIRCNREDFDKKLVSLSES